MLTIPPDPRAASTTYRRNPRLWHPDFPALRINRDVLQMAVEALKGKRLRVLDIGCGERPFQPLFPGSEYVGADITVDGARPDVIADSCRLPFPDALFDLCIASETLEHTRDYELAVGELLRVTRGRGYVFISVPFAFPLHQSPFDYQRVTEFRMLDLLKGHEIVAFRASNTLFSTWILMLQYLVTYVFSTLSVLRPLVQPAALLLNVLAAGLDLVARSGASAVRRLPAARRWFAARIHHPRGLDGALENMPCGYAFLIRKSADGRTRSEDPAGQIIRR